MPSYNSEKLPNHMTILLDYSLTNNDSQVTNKKWVLLKEINYSFSPCGN
jgi:hypothetical protein